MQEVWTLKMEKLQKTVGFLESPKKIRKTDFSLCFVCQDEKKENLSIIKSSKKLLETLETSADPKFRRLLTEASKDSFLFKSPKWHSSCHRQLMYTIRKGTSAPEGCSSTENVSTTRKKTRSEPAAVSFSYKTCCLFCSKTGSSKKNSLKLSNVETFSRSEAIVLKANLLWLTLPVVFSRVSGTDLIAAEAKYHKKCIDKFMATKPKCDVVHDVNKTIFAQFLEGVESRLKEGRIYHISDFKEKLRKVLIDNGLVWQKHRLLWLKRSLDRHFGSQLIKFVNPRKGTFYHLKGTVSAGDMAAQVKAMIEEFEYSAVLIDSGDAGSDSSDSTVIDSDVAVTSKSVTTSDDELGDCSFIDVGNDDGEGENGTRPRRSSVVSESGNSGPSRLSDKYEMEERKNFFYLMTKAKAQLVDSAKDFKESKSSIDLTYDAADSLVPPLLYNIIAFLIGDVSDPPVDSDTKYSLDEQTREKVLNLAQDIMFQSQGIATPKHLALSVHLHYKTRSKSLLLLLNRLGYGVSFTTLQRLLTSEATSIEDTINQTGVYIPDGFKKDQFAHFAFDNLDFQMAPLEGKFTRELIKGTKLIACQVPLPTLTPIQTIGV